MLIFDTNDSNEKIIIKDEGTFDTNNKDILETLSLISEADKKEKGDK